MGDGTSSEDASAVLRSDPSARGDAGHGRVLAVDDDDEMCELVERGLGSRGYLVRSCRSAHQALAVLEQEEPVDVLLTDLALRGMDGLELCRRVAESLPDIPVIVVTAYGNVKTAVGALHAGAWDFATKPIDMDALAHMVDRTLSHRSLRAEVRRLRRRAPGFDEHDGILGESEPMRKLYELISCVAPTDSSVMISGESGTGKELAARALHQRSGRRDGPFVALSCAAVPANLIESELFGYVKGAFTGAQSSREGVFVQAHQGTLFLDEIGELPADVQPKLLRVLQERRVRPVGSARETAIDVRILTATNRDLEQDVEQGRFREALYYRINVVELRMPPLRERGNDILLLARKFLEQSAKRSGKRVRGLSSDAASRLLAYDWPGNVRELANTIESAVALARHEEVRVDDLPEKIRTYKSTSISEQGDDPSRLIPLRELERRYIHRALQVCGGNKSDAARVLGLDRRTLYRKLERYGDSGPKNRGT